MDERYRKDNRILPTITAIANRPPSAVSVLDSLSTARTGEVTGTSVRGKAVFSPCGRYRYRLDRELGGDGPAVGFLLHNPSVASADREDPTSRRGMAFARAWGAVRLTYVNPYARILTKPRGLFDCEDPIGPDNDRHIAEVAAELAFAHGFLVVAFGSFGCNAREREAIAKRRAAALAVVMARGCELRALALAKDGTPRHPARLAAGLVPRPWGLAGWR
jgi:hypothetical protein